MRMPSEKSTGRLQKTICCLYFPLCIKVHSCWTRKIPLRCPVPHGLGVDAGGREGACFAPVFGGTIEEAQQEAETSPSLRVDCRAACLWAHTPHE